MSNGGKYKADEIEAGEDVALLSARATAEVNGEDTAVPQGSSSKTASAFAAVASRHTSEHSAGPSSG